MSRCWRRIAAIALLGLFLAGCDKCGNPVKINAPSIPKTCYGDPVTK